MYRVQIRRFKSIDDLSIEIKPMTILIGPPASGKSNIMEALYPLGLPGKFYKVKEEYDNKLDFFCKNDSNFRAVWRIEEPEDIYPDYNYDNPTELILYINNKIIEKVSINADIEGVTLNFMLENNMQNADSNKHIKDIKIRMSKNKNYCLISSSQPPSSVYDLISIINNYSNINNLIEIRYYSLDKYNINKRFKTIVSCTSKNNNIASMCKVPRHVLAESAINLAWRALRSPNVIMDINSWLDELNVGIEILTKNKPAIEFYEKPIEVKPNLLSEGIQRTLYYIIAVSSAINYYKLKNVRQILLLEEPEAHVYPYITNLLIDYLERGVKEGVYFVISTHNPYLVDSIAERIKEKDLSIYYIYKDVGIRRTKAIKITSELLKKSEAYAPGDFLLTTPDEINR